MAITVSTVTTLFLQAKMAELVEIDSARENRLVGLLLRTSAANQQMRPDNATAASETAFWTGGIVREAAQILV